MAGLSFYFAFHETGRHETRRHKWALCGYPCLKADNENSVADLVIGIANFWPEALQANETLPVPERLDVK
ncbi:hypothetical protein H3S80_10180 [Bartonella sp. M0177]|uniref:hypothetical protein n=1 Tax=Bartonella sp. M0177 TaxID=2750940 RepID=UPI0018DCBDDF|nr:hypothetical protein [Bartonella sp. M0177]MBI0004408.1 hypothetical protein [Bartonella sp. M0177]